VPPAALGDESAGGSEDARAVILEAGYDGRGAPIDHGSQGMNPGSRAVNRNSFLESSTRKRKIARARRPGRRLSDETSERSGAGTGVELHLVHDLRRLLAVLGDVLERQGIRLQ